MLGTCYLLGDGVEKDYDKAKLLLKKSADQGNSKAMEILNNLK